MMFRNYLTNVQTELRAGIAEHQATVGRRMIPLSIGLSVLVAVYIVIAIFLIPPNESRDFNFVNERGAITALSAMFLAMACGFSCASFLISVGLPRAVRCFWLIVSVALAFLVLDELLEFHERIGDRLDRIDLLGWTSSGMIRGWNDVIVILYGVVALPLGLFILPTMARFPSFVKLICIAFSCYVVHTTIDTLVQPPTTPSVVCEESAKLYCSLFIALACLSGLLVRATRPSNPRPSS